ncbi:inter-alpha-trypsin inhibitor heavy chain H3-like [Penaeus monodon]|uniref:inter-alpha-trypsin inhibitor heavy chain H3-like n=1 Tax=Penaeus monodon TaxID=6687 RepID=UPI0018A7AA19|nr:inter-alpha-trypsin inhibitor heavy chain H3-like [Penaeus monodon]
MWLTRTYLALRLLFTVSSLGYLTKAQLPGVVTSFKISGRIESRYAVTRVTSQMHNPSGSAEELKFKMALPKTAFISSFIMEIEGKNYTSNVKEKSEAKRTYTSAKQRGKSTGLVEQRKEADHMFEVSTNVAAKGRVIFYLTYEELLRRDKEGYLYSVQIRPGHVIPAVQVEVEVIEREALTNMTILEVPGDNINAVRREDVRLGNVLLRYEYEVPPDRGGLDGVFSFKYDIARRPDGGELQQEGKYFVHYFSPEGLPKMPVHTVFVLDISTSMEGNKIVQLKKAMEAILRDLKPEDTFELVTFSTDVKTMGFYKGTKHQIEKAVKKVRNLRTTGSTNLNEAYIHSINKLNDLGRNRTAKQVVFLTDGQATVGITRSQAIRANVRQENVLRHPIYGLAFGDGADLKLLQEVSADNRAFARQIDEHTDPEKQLIGFYQEIATPLMADVEVSYLEDEVDPESVVKQGTTHYYSGGEVVTAGVLAPGATRLEPVVRGVGKAGPIQFSVNRLHANPAPALDKDNYVARLWAYLAVQDLLSKASVEENKDRVARLKAEALDIALRFHFVTKLTSLVVVRPEDEQIEEEEKEEGWEEDIKAEAILKGPGTRLAPAAIVSGPGTRFHAPASIVRGPGARFHAPTHSKKIRKTGRDSSSHFVDNDPHFVVHVDGLHLPLCFDLHASDGASLSLIQDAESGIRVNGQVSAATHNPSLTYFTTLFLSLGPLNVTVTHDFIHVDCLSDDGTQMVRFVSGITWPARKKGAKSQSRGRGGVRRGRRGSQRQTRSADEESPADSCDLRTSWEDFRGMKYDDVILTRVGRKKFSIVLGGGDTHFVVVRSRNKRHQRFLGFYVKESGILSASTGGVIGQFIYKEVTAVSETTLTINEKGKLENVVQLAMQHHSATRTHEFSETSGIMAKRRSSLSKNRVRCLHVRNSGRGILDGAPADYLLPCLAC